MLTTSFICTFILQSTDTKVRAWTFSPCQVRVPVFKKNRRSWRSLPFRLVCPSWQTRWVVAFADTGEAWSTAYGVRRRCLRVVPEDGDGESLRENPDAHRPRI